MKIFIAFSTCVLAVFALPTGPQGGCPFLSFMTQAQCDQMKSLMGQPQPGSTGPTAAQKQAIDSYLTSQGLKAQFDAFIAANPPPQGQQQSRQARQAAPQGQPGGCPFLSFMTQAQCDQLKSLMGQPQPGQTGGPTAAQKQAVDSYLTSIGVKAQFDAFMASHPPPQGQPGQGPPPQGVAPSTSG